MRKKDGALFAAFLVIASIPFVVALTGPEGAAYAARTAGSSSASASGSYNPRPPTSGSGSSSYRPPPPPVPTGSYSAFKK